MDKKQMVSHLLEITLRHLYNIEEQTYDNLGLLAQNARSDELKKVYETHRQQTAEQQNRLKKIFEMLQLDINKTRIGEAEGLLEKGKEALRSLITFSMKEKSKGMSGIIDEVKMLYNVFADTEISDVVSSSGSLLIEQFEVEVYTGAVQLARFLGQTQVENLLKTSLEEEKQAHQLLSQFAQQGFEQVQAAAQRT